jgi:hypothetical protein
VIGVPHDGHQDGFAGYRELPLQIELLIVRCCICSKSTAGFLLEVDLAASGLGAEQHRASTPRF